MGQGGIVDWVDDFGDRLVKFLYLGLEKGGEGGEAGNRGRGFKEIA